MLNQAETAHRIHGPFVIRNLLTVELDHRVPTTWSDHRLQDKRRNVLLANSH